MAIAMVEKRWTIGEVRETDVDKPGEEPLDLVNALDIQDGGGQDDVPDSVGWSVVCVHESQEEFQLICASNAWMIPVEIVDRNVAQRFAGQGRGAYAAARHAGL